MAAIPTGTYLGDRLYKRWQPSHGQSWALGLGSGITALAFQQLHTIISPAPEEPSNDSFMSQDEWERSDQFRSWEKDDKRWKRTNTLVELAGYPIGMYLANHFWGNKSITFGDGLMLTQGTISGSLYGFLLAVLLGVDVDDGETWRLFPVLGGSAGTYLMDRYIAGYDYRPGQAIVSALGTVSGFAFMAGIAVITETRNEKALSAFLLSGGIGGLLLTNKIFKLKKEKKDRLTFRDIPVTVMPSFHMRRVHGKAIPVFSVAATF
jgi:hypothetical protein